MKNKIIKDIQGRFLDTIRKKNTSCWKEYTYNAKQKASDDNIRRTMKELNNPIKIQIPLKENIRYKRYEKVFKVDCCGDCRLDLHRNLRVPL